MQNTSSLYKELIKQSGRLFRAEIAVTFPNGSTTTLTDKNIMQDSLVITSGRSDEGSFSIGNAIIGQLDFEIDNSSGAYDNLSFEDAVFDVRVALIVRQSYDGTLTPEWIRKGIFTAEEVTVDENYIKVTAYDNLAKLDVPFSDSGITFPVTLGNLYQSVCAHCSVPYGNTDFSNSNLVITSGNDIDENTSCRDVLSYIAQLACRFVYADVYGTVRLGWYREFDYTILEQQKLNGTVTISGVQLTDTTDQIWLKGNKSYCIMIDNNPLALTGAALTSEVWEDILIGMELTPFSSELLSDPSLEVGDIVTVSDLHGNTYRTPVTNMVYCLDGKMTVSCAAETLKEKQRTSCSTSARIAVQTNRRINRKISEYDVRAKQFSMLMANAMGFFQTDVTQADGSTISYLHDKPELSDSQTIWKRSIDGFAVSTDGGQTYRAGFDSQGNAVFNILAAVGIVANWINVGTLSGIEIIANTGSIAGWEMNNGTLVSSDGTLRIDSRNNTISIYKNNNKIGDIGYATDGDNQHGIAVNITDNGSFISFGKQVTGTSHTYDPVFQYTRGEGFEFTGDVKIAGNLTVYNNLSAAKMGGYDLIEGTYISTAGAAVQYWGWKDDS